MPAKKKQPKNAFYFFMLDVQEEVFRLTKRRPPMKDLPGIANPRWIRMTDAERAPYVHRAKVEKSSGPSTVREGRRDNQGELLSERREPMLELEERREKERWKLKAIIKEGREAVLQEFYFINFQYLLEMPEDQTDLRYQPMEVAITKYSLESGIMDTFHTFIDPGTIPLGFRYECQLHSDKTHQIPITSFELADDNYRQILSNIETFINPSHQPHTNPLFALRSQTVMCEQCLEWMQDQVGHMLPQSVQEIEILYKLLDQNIDATSSVTVFSAERKLMTEEWSHSRGVRCPYHERNGSNHCALSTVKKYCFVFSEELCPKYNVALTTNHLPLEEPVQFQTYTLPSSSIRRTGPPQRSNPSLTSVKTVGGRGVVQAPTSQERKENIGRGRGVLALRQPNTPHGVLDTASPTPTPVPTPAPSLVPSSCPPISRPPDSVWVQGSPDQLSSLSGNRQQIEDTTTPTLTATPTPMGVWGNPSTAAAHLFANPRPPIRPSPDRLPHQGVAQPRAPPPGFANLPRPTGKPPCGYYGNMK